MNRWKQRAIWREAWLIIAHYRDWYWGYDGWDRRDPEGRSTRLWARQLDRKHKKRMASARLATVENLLKTKPLTNPQP